jgi:hypothetical protein
MELEVTHSGVKLQDSSLFADGICQALLIEL